MFYITSYLLILLGILALPLIEGIHFVSFLSFLLFTFGYIFTQLYRKFQLSKEMRNALLISAFALGPITVFVIGRFGEWEIVWLSWYILLAMQITSIFSLKNNRGWIFSYLISSLQIAIAGVFTERMLFLVLFLFYLILTVFNFILLLPRIEVKEKFLKLLKSKADFTKWGAVTTVNVFFITALIFFILPRTENPLFKVKKGMHLADKLKKEIADETVKENLELQFPEKPSLGSFSNVKQKDALIMIVETTKPFLWRVKSFNSYKDGGWSSVGSKPVEIRIKDKKVNLKPIYLRKELFAKIKPEQFYYQKFYIRNYAQNLIIGAYPIVEIDDIPGTNIRIDHFENIYLEKKIGMGSSYEVVSIDKKYPSDYLRSLPRKYPQEIINLYLRLPFDLDKKILDLTDKILKNAPSNVYDEVVILREYLKRNCRYGLINESNSPALSEFLFGEKEGDCEYFATALALMLRYRNIPTRFVIGFSGGEFDSQKRTSMIYARNAHAWIEIFFPTIGWLPCDATPGRAYRKQWSDVPNVMVLKPEKVSSKGQPVVKGVPNVKGGVGNKEAAKGEEIVKEGVPENELLPDKYLFREELAAGKTEQKEVVFGKEFFEKETAAGVEEQVSEEVSTEEAAAGGVEEQAPEEVSTEEAAAGGEELVPEEVSTEETAAGVEEQAPAEVSTEEAAAGVEEQAPEEVSTEEAAAGVEEQAPAEVSAEEAAAGGVEQVSEEEVSTEEAAAGGVEEQAPAEVSTEEAAAGVEEQAPEEVSTEEAAAGVEEQALAEVSTDEEAAGGVEEQAPAEVPAEEAAAGVEEQVPAEVSTDEEAAAGVEEQAPAEVSTEEAAAGVEEQAPEEEVSTEEAAAGIEEQVSEEVSTEETAAGGEEQVSEEEVSTEATVAGGEEQAPEEVSTEEAVAGGVEKVSEEVSTEEAAAGGEELVSEEEGFLAEEVSFEEQTVSVAEERPVDVLDEGISEEVVSSEEQKVSGETGNDILEEERKEAIAPIPDLEIVKGEEKISDEDIVFEEKILAEEEVPKESEVSEEKLIKEETPEEKLSEQKPPGKIVKEELPEEEMISEEDKLLAGISYEQVQEPGQEAVEEKLPEEKQSAESAPDEESVFDETTQEQVDMKSPVLDKFFIFKWLKERLEKWVLKFSYYTQKMIAGFFKNIVVQIAVFIKVIISEIMLHVKKHRTPYVILFSFFILLALCRHIILKIIRKRAEKAKITRLFPRRRLTQEEKVITNFYLYVLRLLEKIGYKRYPYLTPREFAQQLLAKGFKISKGFLYLTDMFYKISFGHMEVELVEMQKIHKITDDIKIWTKEMKY